MTISIDKGLYDNHYKTREELLKEGYTISKKREKEIEIEVIDLKKKYPNIFNK